MSNSSISNIISGLALIVSCIAIWVTHNLNRRQKSLIESQEKLNHLYLKKELQSSENDRKAELGASFVRVGPKNSYRLKVWNKGKAPAKNVSIEFPNGNEIIPDSEIKSKFPLESLEPQTGVELLAMIHMGTEPKHVVKLVWDDDLKSRNEKTIHLTF